MFKDNSKTYILIGERLKTLRKEAGFTSYETFAFEHELGRRYYWEIEKGKNISIEFLLRLLDIHNLTIAEFFNHPTLKNI